LKSKKSKQGRVPESQMRASASSSISKGGYILVFRMEEGSNDTRWIEVGTRDCQQH